MAAGSALRARPLLGIGAAYAVGEIEDQRLECWRILRHMTRKMAQNPCNIFSLENNLSYPYVHHLQHLRASALLRYGCSGGSFRVWLQKFTTFDGWWW